jgi:hypothetical protein
MTSQQAFQQQLLTALTARPDPKAELRDMVALMASMREAFAPPPPPPAPPVQPPSTITELIQGLKELQSAADLVSPREAAESDELVKMLPSVLDTIKALATQRPASPPPASGDGRPALPAPEPQPNEDDMLKTIKAGIRPLLDMAARAAPIDEGVDYVCDHLPEEAAELMEDPGAIALLVNFMPEAAQHAAWLEQVRAAWAALPVEPDDEDPQPPPNGIAGNGDDQSKNAN